MLNFKIQSMYTTFKSKAKQYYNWYCNRSRLQKAGFHAPVQPWNPSSHCSIPVLPLMSHQSRCCGSMKNDANGETQDPEGIRGMTRWACQAGSVHHPQQKCCHWYTASRHSQATAPRMSSLDPLVPISLKARSSRPPCAAIPSQIDRWWSPTWTILQLLYLCECRTSRVQGPTTVKPTSQGSEAHNSVL